MGFSMIVPAPKAKTGTFKISTVSMRGSPFRLQISIPSALFTLMFKQADKFDLLLGEGVDKGKMMLKPDASGHFKPTFMKHTVIFRLPETAWTPQIALAAEDPKRREVEGGGNRHRASGLDGRGALEVDSEGAKPSFSGTRNRAAAGCW
jgi:hypothetical protein